MQKTLKLIIAMIAVGCSSTSISNGVMHKKELAKKILFDLSPANGPGIQYVVVNKDSILFEHSTGLSNVESKVPLSLNHTLTAFSMTKTLTAVAVLQLSERKTINLNDHVSKYFKHPYDSGITIRHLLSHTSGIPNPIPLRWVHLVRNHDSFDEQTAMDQVLQDNPNSDSKPGTKYIYSNIGYWLLGKVVENVTGKKYTDYITEYIFEPLELSPDEIGFKIKDVNSQAKGYLKMWSFMNFFGRFLIDGNVIGESEGSWVHIKNVYTNGPSFGGVVGTARAFSRILQDLLAENSKLLGPSAKQLLYLQQKVESGKKIAMTLGWHIGQLGSLTYYYKEGGGAGFSSEMRVYPESGLATVLMTNRTSFDFKKNLSKLDEVFVID